MNPERRMPEELAKASPVAGDAAPESGMRAKTPDDKLTNLLKAAAAERDSYRAEAKDQAIGKVRTVAAAQAEKNRRRDEATPAILATMDKINAEADEKALAAEGKAEKKPRLELVMEEDEPAPEIESHEVNETAFTPEEMSALADDVREARRQERAKAAPEVKTSIVELSAEEMAAVRSEKTASDAKKAEAVRRGIENAELGLTEEEQVFFAEGDKAPTERGMVEEDGDWRKGERIEGLKGDVAKMESDLEALEGGHSAKSWFRRALDRKGAREIAGLKARLAEKRRSLERLEAKQADPKRYAEMTRLGNENRPR